MSVASPLSSEPVPVLEVGGTHVTTAWASESGEVEVVDRIDLDSSGSAPQLVSVLVEAGRGLLAPDGAAWGAAVPGPFDYDAGIGDYTGVEKFQSLRGVDLGDALRRGLGAAQVHFINDADAFGVGEWMTGALVGMGRGVAMTLGTGIGSAFIADGLPVVTGDEVPHLGEVHTITLDGVPLEQIVSRAAIRRSYRDLTGEWLDVKQIAERAYAVEPAALEVFDEAFAALAQAMIPVLHRFRAEALVIGGSIAQSRELVSQYLTGRLLQAGPGGSALPVAIAPDPMRSALVGVAHWVNARQAGRGGYSA
ncbi:ROK family protein [Tessaracoccus sp. SD287]|uniref:ROK family protein n=1 Tax=Tessaracoccus sp. SD287 TaxID=2782008 RepID=UPI001A96F602|nr:ROK family protein [Tessaracoccus sp. SD287]MBO1030297.1 ROK family protein [Tessaracoccus sp. SD287]